MGLYEDVTKTENSIQFKCVNRWYYLYEDGRIFEHSDDMGPGSVSTRKPSQDMLASLYTRIRNLEYDRDIEKLQQKKEKLNK